MLAFLADVALPLALAFIMLTLGLSVQSSDFRAAIKAPKALVLGLVAQMAILPAVVYAFVTALGHEGETAFGIALLSACPGGVTTAMFTKMAGGRLALSIAMTTVATLAAPLTIPLWTQLWSSLYLGQDAPEIEILPLALKMAAITLVPVVLGMVIRHLAPSWSIRWEPLLYRVAGILFWLVILMGVIQNWDALASQIAGLVPQILGLAAVLTFLGWSVAAMFGLGRADRLTLAIETGIQNGTLGLALISLIFGLSEGVPPVAMPIIVYGVLIYSVVAPLALIAGRRGRLRARAV